MREEIRKLLEGARDRGEIVDSEAAEQCPDKQEPPLKKPRAKTGASKPAISASLSGGPGMIINLTINAGDMRDWDDGRIKAFFDGLAVLLRARQD